MRISRIFGFSLATIAGIITIYLSSNTQAIQTGELYEAVMKNYIVDTSAENSVASIYLNYRMFDTIFEALMLLVSVMGVIHFSRHEHDIHLEFVHMHTKSKISTNSKNAIAVLIPLIIMLGFYLIVNGHNTPGGGFQGGAALSSAFICIYLIRPDKMINFLNFEKIEKILFLLIALTSLFFAVSKLYYIYPQYNIAYLVIMNLLIGFKVFCGLSIVFYRFVHYEDT